MWLKAAVTWERQRSSSSTVSGRRLCEHRLELGLHRLNGSFCLSILPRTHGVGEAHGRPGRRKKLLERFAIELWPQVRNHQLWKPEGSHPQGSKHILHRGRFCIGTPSCLHQARTMIHDDEKDPFFAVKVEVKEVNGHNRVEFESLR